MYNMLKG